MREDVPARTPRPVARARSPRRCGPALGAVVALLLPSFAACAAIGSSGAAAMSPAAIPPSQPTATATRAPAARPAAPAAKTTRAPAARPAAPAAGPPAPEQALGPGSGSGEDPAALGYYFDGGALPFIYGSAALDITFALTAPRSTPLFFSNSEGGATPVANIEVPSWTVALGAGLAGAAIALTPSDARWYHLKGFAESILTTGALTEIAKDVVGRHRPDYNLSGPNPPDERRSFFSGHAATSAATAMYLALYLHSHVFDALEGDGLLRPLVEIGTDAGLAGLTGYVSYTRVADHRHNLSDVLTGMAVGATVSALFFTWQEHRYDSMRAVRQGNAARSGSDASGTHPVMVVPSVNPWGGFISIPF